MTGLIVRRTVAGVDAVPANLCGTAMVVCPASDSKARSGLDLRGLRGGGHAWLVLGHAADRHATLPARSRPELVPVDDVTEGERLNTVVIPVEWMMRSAVVPLFYLVPVSGGWRAYVQVLVTPAELLFVEMGEEVIPDEVMAGETWFDWLIRRYSDCALRVANHQQVFTVHRPDDEIEHKFTLGGDIDIWSLSVEMLRSITSGQLAGWMAEYRNEFEQWDFMNHLFEIAEPLEERGYVSFIPTVDGRWIVKRKWFTMDQPIRQERRDRNVVLPADADLAREIIDRFGVTPTWGASFRRMRFDVNVESFRTGHGYSIMFDRCTTVADPPATLQQCEVEYLRSRTLRAVHDAELMDEFGALCFWVRAWLQQRGVDAVEDHLSKLTFLRAVTHSTIDGERYQNSDCELRTC